MDPVTGGAGLAAAGANALPFLNLASGIYSGQKNLQGIRETNAANKAMAKAQMRFQERMSSTAHQRQVADLRAAGLNPILSGTGGSGASAPAGASATMQAPDYSFIGDSFRDSINSGLSAMQISSAVAKTNAETLNALETNKAIRAQTKGQLISNARTAGLTPHEIAKMGYEASRSEVASAKEKATMPSEVLRAQAEASKSRTGAAAARAELPAVEAVSRVSSENAAIDKILEQISSAASIPSKLLNFGDWFRSSGKGSSQKGGKR